MASKSTKGPQRGSPSRPGRKSATPDFRKSRNDVGNPFVEGFTGIAIVALAALAAVAMGGILAVLISLLY